MKNGFSFKGVHSSSIANLTVKTISRPITPQMRTIKFNVPFADGDIDFSNANPFKRHFYEGRIFKIRMSVTATNLTQLNKKLSKISEWLLGDGKLIFDDMPLVEWSAQVNGGMDYAPEAGGKIALLDVAFSVSAYSSLIWSMKDGPMLDVKLITLGNNIAIGFDSLCSFGVTKNEDNYEIVNIGTRAVRPVITVETDEANTEGYLGGISLFLDGKEMCFDCNNEKVIIDCANYTAEDNNGNNIMSSFSGQFFELKPGKNILTVKKSESATTGVIVITVDFKPQFMWDFDVENSDRGNSFA